MFEVTNSNANAHMTRGNALAGRAGSVGSAGSHWGVAYSLLTDLNIVED